jgi:hypothetical protein
MVQNLNYKNIKKKGDIIMNKNDAVIKELREKIAI